MRDDNVKDLPMAFLRQLLRVAEEYVETQRVAASTDHAERQLWDDLVRQLGMPKQFGGAGLSPDEAIAEADRVVAKRRETFKVAK